MSLNDVSCFFKQPDLARKVMLIFVNYVVHNLNKIICHNWLLTVNMSQYNAER